jgi:8-oxo-dGTP diphosphatase
MVTVDTFLLRFFRFCLQVLLIQRDQEPFSEKWALPGGFIEMEESLLESAKRELFEETGLENIDLFQLGVAGNPGRDPRGRTISIIFGGILSPPFPDARAGDDAKKTKWFSLNKMPLLAFDHKQIIINSHQKVKEKMITQLLIFKFLPQRFQENDLKKLSETVFDDLGLTEMVIKRGISQNLIKKVETYYLQKNLRIGVKNDMFNLI